MTFDPLDMHPKRSATERVDRRTNEALKSFPYGASEPTRPLSNRFDPFWALDELLELSPLAGVRRTVGLLRAYITGMER